MNYTIKNKFLELTATSFGAQIISIKKQGVERIWQNADGSWEDHAPVLFPVCGRCSVIIDNKDYKMPFHGFALTSKFILVKKKDNYIEFLLKSNKETKKYYPYDFEFKVVYKIVRNKLIIKYIAKNLSKKEMYFSCGAHDSFVLPKKLEKYKIKFNKKENLITYYDDNGVLTDKTKNFGFTDLINIKGSGLKDDGSLIFKNINSDKVFLLDDKNKKVVEVGFKGYHNFVFWRTKNNDMICIEPWLNLPDDKKTKKMAFKEKDGVKTLRPKKVTTLKRYIKYY